MRDVLHERRVRADDEDAPQLLAMRVEQVRGAMEPHRRLAGSRAALHDERPHRLARDQPVLVGLDRRDDVAHPRLAAPVELVEQEVAARDGAGAVELFVAHVEDAPTLRTESTPQRHVVGIRRRRDVEGPRGGRLPVDDEQLVVVVVHPAPSDVERPRRRVEVEAPEAEAALRILEGPEPPNCPRLDGKGRDLVVGRVRCSHDPIAHAVEAVVRVVDVCLLRGEVGVRHAVKYGRDGQLARAGPSFSRRLVGASVRLPRPCAARGSGAGPV